MIRSLFLSLALFASLCLTNTVEAQKRQNPYNPSNPIYQGKAANTEPRYGKLGDVSPYSNPLLQQQQWLYQIQPQLRYQYQLQQQWQNQWYWQRRMYLGY